MMSTTTMIETNIHVDRLVEADAVGALGVAGGGPTGAVILFASATGVLTGSAGAGAAVGVAAGLCGRAAVRVWRTPATTGGALAVSAGALAVAAGTVAAGTVAAGTAAAGAASVGRSMTVSGGELTVASGASAAGATAGAAGGVLTVSEGVLTVAAGAAAAAEQCSEIMFSSVTAMEFSALPLRPVRLTSWSTYALRSLLLVVILKILPVEFSATV